MKLVQLPAVRSQGRESDIWVSPLALDYVEYMDENSCLVELAKGSLRVPMPAHAVVVMFNTAMHTNE